jgi:hypothetical protein
MHPTVEFAVPEVEKLAQLRESRRYIELLPYKALKDAGVVRHMVKDLGGCQTIVFELPGKAHQLDSSVPVI